MIKLKHLISENITQPEFGDDYIIIGMISNMGVESHKTFDSNKKHINFGYYISDLNWRYNPITKTVYWWNLNNKTALNKNEVKKHLQDKYKVEVVTNKPMRFTQKDVTADQEEAEAEWIANRQQRNSETHPFSSWYAPDDGG